MGGTRIRYPALAFGSDAETRMTKRSVDVFDRHGHLIHTYTIVLDDKDCHEAEYEEVALIFAERSGWVATEEFIHLRARCA